MKYSYLIPILFFTACSLAPDVLPPLKDAQSLTPNGWKAAESSGAVIGPEKWEDFGSAELKTLMQQALTHNTDLEAALARIEQARAATIIAGSGLFPQVEANANASTDRLRSNGRTVADDGQRAGLSVGYEVDLWQRNNNQRRVALAQEKAVIYDRAALELTVLSETARLYSGALALSERVAKAEKNLEAFRDVLRITEARKREGAISGLELAQQLTAVRNAESSLESLKAQGAIFVNQLATLTGRASQAFTLPEAELASMRVPDITLTDPISLLSRRPDVAVSEELLRASNFDIGVARANALPSLQLNLEATVTGNPSSSLLDLGASLFAPIFQGGALQAAIDAANARQREALANYKGVLLNAFQEVENALVNYDAANARKVLLAEAAEQARKAYRITRVQYDNGSVDFQALLDTQRSMLQAEDSDISAKQEWLAAGIDLFRALGGEWKKNAS